MDRLVPRVCSALALAAALAATSVFTAAAAPDRPEVSVSSHGRLSSSSSVTISGSDNCQSNSTPNGTITIAVTDPANRDTGGSGTGTTTIPCDGQSHTWQISVTATSGSFDPGNANVVTAKLACTGPHGNARLEQTTNSGIVFRPTG
jgi:hypothetical protein